jgi:hypothetical protein
MPGQFAFVDFELHCRRRPIFRTIGSSNAEATAGPATLSGQLDVNDPSTANEENDPLGFLGVGCLRIWALGVYHAVRNGWYSQRYTTLAVLLRPTTPHRELHQLLGSSPKMLPTSLTLRLRQTSLCHW